jgi:hypothetical protein
MAKKLKNIKINWLSLVKKGANQRHVLLKFADGEAPELRAIPFAKVDDEKKLVYGVVYAPDSVDAHGDFTTKDEIEKASQDFMKSMKNLNVDKDHSFKSEHAFVAESWIIRKGDPLFPGEPEGSWAVAIKIEDQELWKSLKDNGYTGLSMAGTAEKIDDQEGLLKKAYEILKQIFTKESKDMTKEEIVTIVKESIPRPLGTEEMAKIFKSAFEESIKPVLERIEKVEKSTEGSKQDPKPIEKSDSDLEAIGRDIAKKANGGK